MNYNLLPLLLLLTACSQAPSQNFNREEVCSTKALRFLKDRKGSRPELYVKNQVHHQLLFLEPSIQSCYKKEAETAVHASYVCLVASVDKQGEVEFIDLASKNHELSAETMKCLKDLEARTEFEGMSNVIITQPYKLVPKNK